MGRVKPAYFFCPGFLVHNLIIVKVIYMSKVNKMKAKFKSYKESKVTRKMRIESQGNSLLPKVKDSKKVYKRSKRWLND
jgi:hypothetical protein